MSAVEFTTEVIDKSVLKEFEDTTDDVATGLLFVQEESVFADRKSDDRHTAGVEAHEDTEDESVYTVECDDELEGESLSADLDVRSDGGGKAKVEQELDSGRKRKKLSAIFKTRS